MFEINTYVSFRCNQAETQGQGLPEEVAEGVSKGDPKRSPKGKRKRSPKRSASSKKTRVSSPLAVTRTPTHIHSGTASPVVRFTIGQNSGAVPPVFSLNRNSATSSSSQAEKTKSSKTLLQMLQKSDKKSGKKSDKKSSQ